MITRPAGRARALPTVLAALGVLAAVNAAPAAAGTAPSGNAWVVVRQPALAAYTPASRDQWNSAGGAITVTRSGTGDWDVTLPGQGAAATDNGGHVQVTALGSAPAICAVGQWSPSGADIVVTVRCDAVTGGAIDTAFSLGWVHESYDAGYNPTFAYLYLDTPGDAAGTPQLEYQHNVAGGGSITFTSASAGNHTFQIPGMGRPTFVTVAPYGLRERCRVIEWYPVVGGAAVETGCGGAVPGDARLVLYVARRTGPVGFGLDGATLWADRAGATATYRPQRRYRWTSRTPVPAITRTGTGVYLVRFGGFSPGGAAFVSAYGSLDRTCQAGAIPKTGASATVTVRCFRANGSPANAQFTLGWVR